MDVNEVVILCIIFRLPFTPCHEPSPLLLEVVDNGITSYLKLLKCREGCICVADSYLLPDKPILGCTPDLP